MRCTWGASSRTCFTGRPRPGSCYPIGGKRPILQAVRECREQERRDKADTAVMTGQVASKNLSRKRPPAIGKSRLGRCAITQLRISAVRRTGSPSYELMDSVARRTGSPSYVLMDFLVRRTSSPSYKLVDWLAPKHVSVLLAVFRTLVRVELLEDDFVLRRAGRRRRAYAPLLHAPEQSGARNPKRLGRRCVVPRMTL